jgi:hypothetical protein
MSRAVFFNSPDGLFPCPFNRAFNRVSQPKRGRFNRVFNRVFFLSRARNGLAGRFLRREAPAVGVVAPGQTLQLSQLSQLKQMDWGEKVPNRVCLGAH